MDAVIQWLEELTSKSKERLITTSNYRENKNNRDRKTEIIKMRNQKREQKELHGHFRRQNKDIAHEMTWIWQYRGKLKREIQSLSIATQKPIMYIFT